MVVEWLGEDIALDNLAVFFYTAISIVYLVASYIDKYAEDGVMLSHLIPFWLSILIIVKR